ncbi:hypothetical protein CARUB_v10012574mg [Capsella rubella]|uniref:Uncharacterized protein n=1 Tax=Capsella rubella TaxID=81985 RepID=R0IEQ1_9BRAS|nr:uncharacterized protein LOC17898810 [Capsella rubella]EOA36740.1 hypothetical protein CARUB_v10012574mg [Capsella rubella]
MDDNVRLSRKSESPKSPTRLQRQAPTALHLERVPNNPFLQQSSDVIAAAAIPLLSPLFVSPSPRSSLSTEGHDFTFPVEFTEKNGSQPSMDHKEIWQYSAKVDHSNQMALLNMFQTKFVLVDHSQ